MVAFGAIACVASVAHAVFPRFAVPLAHHELAGAAVALVLAFRTSTAYDRFWEGRALWGRITNASRNLTRIVEAHADASPAAARALATWAVVFAHAARRSLRGEPRRPEVARLIDAEHLAALSAHPNPPLYAARQLSIGLAAFARAGLDAHMAAQAESQVVDLVEALGGCERILKTPTPLGYVLLIQRCVVLYLASLPLGLIGELGPLTPLLTMMVAYPILMIEALGRELDDPFGHEPNDLPLANLTEAIERDLLGTSSRDVVSMSSTDGAFDD